MMFDLTVVLLYLYRCNEEGFIFCCTVDMLAERLEEIEMMSDQPPPPPGAAPGIILQQAPPPFIPVQTMDNEVQYIPAGPPPINGLKPYAFNQGKTIVCGYADDVA